MPVSNVLITIFSVDTLIDSVKYVGTHFLLGLTMAAILIRLIATSNISKKIKLHIALFLTFK